MSPQFLLSSLSLSSMMFRLKHLVDHSQKHVWQEVDLRTISHEIKRRLLLGRKVMTNLDGIFKSRDITLPTKVRLVKAMVFPVVIWMCELDYKES